MSWKRPLFALLTVVLFFGAIEAALWVAGVDGLLQERDPFQGFSGAIRVYEPDPERDVWRTPRRALRHSFAYQEFAATKPGRGFRFFVMGGSTAVGFPWGVEVAFPHQLGEALRATWPNRPLEAVNAAAMSYGSHRLRILAEELLRHEPDLLIVYAGHNEFVERRFYSELLERPQELDFARRLLYRSRLVAVLQRAWESSSPGPSNSEPETERNVGELLGLDVAREYSREVDDDERTAALAHFRENMRAILKEAHRASVPVMLCTVPSNLRDWRPNQSFFDRSTPSADRRRVLELLAEAQVALDEGAPREATERLNRALALAPGYAETHFMLGHAYEALAAWAEAGAAYRRARDVDGKPSRATTAINDAIRELSREPGVILVDVARSIEAAAPHGIPGFDLFEDYVHLKPGTHKRVAFELWKALQRGDFAGEGPPAEPEVFWTAVGPIEDEGSGPLASSSGETPQLLFNLAVVLENQGADDEAIVNYGRCLELDPRYYLAGYNLARLLAERGRLDEAIDAYRGVLETEPSFAKAWVGLGEALRRRGALDPAEQSLLRATAEDPRSAHAWSSLGSLLVARNRHDEADAAFRRAIALDPERVENRINLGLTLHFRKRLDEAESVFRDCLETSPDHAAARNGLAAVLAERGRFDEAERLFRESLEADPDDGSARGGLELIRRHRGG